MGICLSLLLPFWRCRLWVSVSVSWEEMDGDSPLSSPTHRPPPSTLTTLPQILSALSSLQSEEAELSHSLSALLADQEPILDSLTRLQTILPRIDELHADASILSHKVSATARTAERVGGRVRALDEEMRRVREASDRVQQVIELKVRPPLSVLSQIPPSRAFSMLVVLVRSPVVYRRAGLGVSNETLCSGHGRPGGRYQRRFCGDRRGRIGSFFPANILIVLSLCGTIAFFGEPLAARTNFEGRAKPPPPGLQAPIHRSD